MTTDMEVVAILTPFLTIAILYKQRGFEWVGTYITREERQLTCETCVGALPALRPMWVERVRILKKHVKPARLRLDICDLYVLSLDAELGHRFNLSIPPRKRKAMLPVAADHREVYRTNLHVGGLMRPASNFGLQPALCMRLNDHWNETHTLRVAIGPTTCSATMSHNAAAPRVPTRFPESTVTSYKTYLK
jgi:hypothetical protein